MKISLLMATYNGEKYIVEQLKSIYNQTVNPDEVLIADDVSNDRTVELIERFIEQHDLKNWKLMINSSNKGYKKNFYDLIQQATGDVIFLSDQDDVWEKNKIELMTKELEKNTKIKKEDRTMLHVMKHDFDESAEDILNSINNMLKKKETEKKKEDKEEKDSKDE